MRTFGDMRTELFSRTGIATSTTFITDTMINTWLNNAYKWSVSYKKWPFTEGRYSTTYSTVEEWNIEGYKADAIRLLYIGGSRYEKITFEDYQIYKEEQTSGTDKIFTNLGRTLFVNAGAGGSGTMTVYGQYTPADIDVTDFTALTVFSDGDEEAHEAVVEEAICYFKLREQNFQEANFHHGKAMQILESVYGKVADEQFNYKTKDRGMFKRFDVLRGGMNDELINRDQFPFG